MAELNCAPLKAATPRFNWSRASNCLQPLALTTMAATAASRLTFRTLFIVVSVAMLLSGFHLGGEHADHDRGVHALGDIDGVGDEHERDVVVALDEHDLLGAGL